MTLCSPTNTITVIGLNPDTLLDFARLEALVTADIIYGSARLQALIVEQRPNLSSKWHFWQSPMQRSLDQLHQDAEQGKAIVVVASGDPMCHGIGATLIRHFPDLQLNILPSPSSFSLAAATLQWPLQQAECLSLHHQNEECILPHLQQNRRILALTKNRHSPHHIAELLCAHGWEQSLLSILQELGSPRQRIEQYTATRVLEEKREFLDLHVLAIVAKKNTRPMENEQIFVSDDALHHDGQFTKFAFRAITLASLNPAQDQLLWDVGAGCGSISCQWLKCGGKVLAFEQNAQRCQYFQQNTDFAKDCCTLLEGDFRETLPNLRHDSPAPDAIFFGGCHETIMTAIPRLRPGGVLVANAVTLQSQQRLLALRKENGGKLRRIFIEEEEPIAQHLALKPARGVLQYIWTKR